MQFPAKSHDRQTDKQAQTKELNVEKRRRRKMFLNLQGREERK